MAEYDYSIHYSRFHEDSEAHAEKSAEWLAGAMKSYVPADKAANILDVGCGYGFALRALRNMGFARVQGLEISPQQAERARQAGFPVEVTDDTAAWLLAHLDQFDFVLLHDVLEHVPVPEQIRFLRAIYACLRPGGRVSLTTPNANSILSSRWRFIDYTHHSSFTEHSLTFVLKNAGFDRVSIDASKGIGHFPRRIWRRSNWPAQRKWIVRWCWLQVFKAEIPWERLDEISFELNLNAIAERG